MAEAVPLIDLVPQYQALRSEIAEAMERVMESQQFILGPEVRELEEAVAAYVGVPRAVGCASGTDALLLPLKALDPEPGDEVVLPAFTFFATAGAVWNAGFTPVFCDVDPVTFNVSAETLEAAWSERTRAVIPVHLFGQMAPMGEITALAEERGAVVIEDGAQALGARQGVGGKDGGDAPDGGEAPHGGNAPDGGDAPHGGNAPDGEDAPHGGDAPEDRRPHLMAGAAGDVGAFSFFPTKNLGGFGDGGMVTARNAELADAVARLRVHGGLRTYHHEVVGTNSRLDTLQAAVLLAKLRHLDGWADARRKNACLYHGALSHVPEVTLPETLPGNYHVYNQYTIRARRRDELRDHLQGKGIGSGVYYPVPLHLQPCFAELGGQEGQLPEAERACREVLSLPVFPELGEERLERVAGAIREFYGADAPG